MRRLRRPPSRDVRGAQRITLPAGALFIEEGEKPGHFYNINEGHVRLFKSLPDGRRQITGFAGPGHFLGLDPAQSVFSAEAMETIKVCRFNRAQLGRPSPKSRRWSIVCSS
jgi:CRP/FNR family transcriptional regulator